jgi:ParB family chromosome partitioning protein
VALIENVQRADLGPLEEADAYAALVERFGHKPEEVGKLVGKSRSHVANLLRLRIFPTA